MEVWPAIQNQLPFDDQSHEHQRSLARQEVLPRLRVVPVVDRALSVTPAITTSPIVLPPVVYARHPRAKRYVLRVADDGRVRVTIPRWGSRREASLFVDAQRPWIDVQLRKARERHARRPPGDPERDRMLRERAARELPARLLELAERCGLAVARVSVRNQRWRWGSCSRNGHICLNWRLVDMPDFVRDYVLIHELMHLKRMDHSAAFWRLVAGACPDYQSARRWLRDMSADSLCDNA
jgi:predicted metal-dependent hydrolase